MLRKKRPQELWNKIVEHYESMTIDNFGKSSFKANLIFYHFFPTKITLV
jgi:hypothetical protein